MSRGNKTENALAIGERLSQALVSVEDQPYPVPENWCWIRLSALSKIISKGTTPSGGKSIYTNVGVAFLRVENLNEDGTISHENIAHIPEDVHLHLLKRSILEEGDILISIAGTLGKTGIVRSVDLPLNTNQALAFVRLVNKGINEKYIKYSIDNPVIQNLLLEKTKVTSIPNLTLEIIGNCYIPLSPLAEQKRIVDRIDSLFAKLDEIKGKAQVVFDSFETRKAAILHKAFAGELTIQWRKENNVELDSWKQLYFVDCINKMQNGIAKRSGSDGVPYIVLRLANLSDDGFITDNLREIILDEKEQIEYELRSNDVLMIRVNGSKENVGKQFLVTNQKNWAFCDHIIRIVYSEKVLPQYMVLFSKSEKYQLYIKDNIVSSAGQNTISRKGMAKLKVPLPNTLEQMEIVHIIENLLNKEKQAKETAETVLKQIETMKKAILIRAFHGGLGTNDPTEESVMELLRKYEELSQ